MYKIQQHRIDLAREFKNKPLGPHSAELQKVLNVMRWQESQDKRTVVCLESGKRWCVGFLNTERLQPIEVDESMIFDNIEDCYWDIFRHRWKDHTGEFPET